MRVKEAREYLDECVTTLNEVKTLDLKVIRQECNRTRPSARLCDSMTFTLVFDKNIFFNLFVNLWVNINEKNKLEYQKTLMEELWKRVKSEREKRAVKQAQKSQTGFHKLKLNGLGTYTPMPGNHELDIEDFEMTVDLEGYRQQQLAKQKRADNKKASQLKSPCTGKYVF